MESRIMYVELKTGHNDDGPAWIGTAYFSKTKKTIYFNGLSFLKGERHSSGNYLEVLSGDSYWISGIKKNSEDRHWAGGGKIKIDKNIVADYLGLINLAKLPTHKFELVELNTNSSIKEFYDRENNKFH
jgi:hypothetical protein